MKDIKFWIPNKKQYTKSPTIIFHYVFALNKRHKELVAKVFDGDILSNGKEVCSVLVCIISGYIVSISSNSQR